MANVTAKSQVNPEIDFFPLTVNYQEKFYSVGKIPGGYFKREARPTEKETLISRLIDRPIRPLFHKDFNNETQVICTVLSHDKENDSAPLLKWSRKVPYCVIEIKLPSSTPSTLAS